MLLGNYAFPKRSFTKKWKKQKHFLIWFNVLRHYLLYTNSQTIYLKKLLFLGKKRRTIKDWLLKMTTIFNRPHLVKYLQTLQSNMKGGQKVVHPPGLKHYLNLIFPCFTKKWKKINKKLKKCSLGILSCSFSGFLTAHSFQWHFYYINLISAVKKIILILK